MVRGKNGRVSLWQWLGIVVAISVILGWSLDWWQSTSTIQVLKREIKQLEDTTTALKPQFLGRSVLTWMKGPNYGGPSPTTLVGTEKTGIMRSTSSGVQLVAHDGSTIATIRWRFLRHLDGRDVYLFAVRPGLAGNLSFDSPEETITYVAYDGERCQVLEMDQFRIEIVRDEVWKKPRGS